MNRAGRRAERRRQRPLARVRLGHGPLTIDRLRCPDCDSDVTIVEAAPGFHRAQVAHSDTCPWYAALRRDLA